MWLWHTCRNFRFVTHQGIEFCPNTSLHHFTPLHFLLWYIWFPDASPESLWHAQICVRIDEIWKKLGWILVEICCGGTLRELNKQFHGQKAENSSEIA
jgi:hypothetical protein